ncbi:solute carrier family 22 member 7 [Rhipicephalus sanguineus]|uniref:solute carrier family 22 member 7 n=1 Tax=Rhipicephalus sanguineus TaxID=34632 RepID=UPI00189408DC|nr:solute carrier family 22 member 7 [Rhipicephalus sanguineus]
MDICDDVSAKTTTPTILQGFVLSDARDILQENVYVILGHGKFQRQVLNCAVFSVIVLLLHAFAYRIIGRPVDHWCRQPDNLHDFTVQEWKNVAIPVLADGSYSKCSVYDPPVPDGSQEERRTVPCDQWDYDIKNKEDDVISRWDLVCQYSWLYSLSSSVYMLGPMLLVPLAGFVSDRFGRRPTMMASAITMLFSCLGAGSSRSFGVFLVARFMVSAAASATNLLVFVVLYEALVVAWCYCIDESPVWLLAVGNVQQAELTILQGARYNGVDLGKARVTFKAFRKQLERLEMAASAGPAECGGTNSTESVGRVVKWRRQVASVLLSWFAVSLAYYGTAFLSLYLEEHWELTGLLLKALLFVTVHDSITRRGQRVTLSGLLLFLCASSVVKTAVVMSDVSVAIPLLSIMVEGSSAASWCVTCMYTTEVFPTTTRGTGLSVSYSVGRVGVILATWLTYVAFHGVPLWLNAVTTVVVFVSALAIQWLPEILVQKGRNKGESTPPKPAVEEQREEDTKATLAHERRSGKNEGGGGSPRRSSPSKSNTPRAEVVTQPSAKATLSRGSPPQERAASTPRRRSTPPKPAIEEQREANIKATLTQERGYLKNEGGGSSPKQSTPSKSQPSTPQAEVVTQPSPKASPSPSGGLPQRERAASTPIRRQRTPTNGKKSPKRRKARSSSPLPSRQAKS